ncbi:MAG: MarR family transcriptional regulator [Streptomyces sp.]|uniref:MarR family winged helix-turn-helix transcriptional regulator n=1 Tax=Streptomyces sp. TaxID=1931 RepID=UPI0025FBF56E|nr:MarR family transcriptional regulator [Streptomyces sp.]MBW8801848.1 MarR family transcriptional regulator [Streptomyces sp.]
MTTRSRKTLPDLGDDPLQLDRQVCFALAVAARTVISVYRPLLEPMGLTHPQYLVMLALWEQSPRSVKDISSALMLDSATLSPLLKRLQSAGYVTRDRNPGDERQLVVELTREGRELRTRALEIPYAVVESLGMGVEPLLALHAQLTTVITAATAALEDPLRT